MKKSVRLPEHIIPERYEILLHPDLEKFTFSGEETIYLSLKKPTEEIILHAVELEIDVAQFIHGKKPIKISGIKFDKKSETVVFKFPKTVPAGKGELKLKFKGVLNDKLRGFYRSRYVVGEQEKFLATTQFESTDARRAFPCIDEPARKAIFDITLMAPPKTVAISNTMPSEVMEHDSGYQIVKFSPTPKMSTYLLAFIVGDFEHIETKTKHGVLVRVFVQPGKKEQAKFALKTTADALDFYDDYFGIAYPLTVMDVISIPDFAAGAMENWGAVTYRESAVLIDPEKSSTGNRQRVAIVIAHELAHQWFGNLVTMDWWTNLWLNEGFASYMEYLAADKLFPEWDLWTQFVYMDMGSALSLDSLKNTHPIEVEVGHPDEISEIFDAVSYSKGASIIRMLAEYLGYEDFRDGLRVYLKRHQYGNARTEDLWKAFEEVSGKPVTKIMSNWTGKPGYPLVSVRQGSGGRELELEQSRFYSSPISKKGSEDKTVWSIPISITAQGYDEKFLMDKKVLQIKAPKEARFKINRGESGFFRTKYEPEVLEALKEPVEGKKLGASDRLGLIRDAFDLSEAGEMSTDNTLNLVSSYRAEDDYTVWAEVSSNIHKLSNLIYSESFYPKFEKFGLELFEEITGKIGWEKKKDEKHTDILLRVTALYNFGSFGDKKTIEKAQQLFKNHISSKELDPDLRNVVYGLAAENGGEKEFNIFLKMYQTEELQHEKDRIARAMSLFKKASILSKTLKFAMSKDVRSQDAIFIISMVWSNPEGRDLAWEFVKKNWPTFKERYSGAHFLLPHLIEPAALFTTAEQLQDFKSFFEKNKTPEAGRTIQQVLEKINSNISWLKRDQKGIEDFLKSI